MPSLTFNMASHWVTRVHQNLHKAAMDAAYEAALYGVQQIQAVIIPSLQPHPPVNRGLYKASWKAMRTGKGARIYNRQYPQAPLIEFGVPAENVKPGMAMQIAIAEWLTMKGLTFRNPEDTVARVAFLISMKLKQTGIFNKGKGYHVLDRVMPRVHDMFGKAYQRRAERAAKKGYL